VRTRKRLSCVSIEVHTLSEQLDYPLPVVQNVDRAAAGVRERLCRIDSHGVVKCAQHLRNGIGNHFTFTLLAMALAVIAQRFRITLCDDPATISPDASLALRPRGGLRVRLHPG
jgi:hypothetical protein